MPHTIEVDESGVVVVVHTDELTMANATESRAQAGRLMRERGLMRVLVDVDQTTYNPNTLDLLDFNKTYYDVFPKGSHIAIVVDAPLQFRQDTEFAETVAQNRGVKTKLFATRESALAWLQSKI